MIVIWRGLGALVILIPIVVCLIMNIATAKAFDETNYFQENLWPKVAALWLTGIVTVVIGLYVHSKPERILIDKATGQEVRQRPTHDFMFIKMEYWGLIFLLVGLGLIAASWLH